MTLTQQQQQALIVNKSKKLPEHQHMNTHHTYQLRSTTLRTTTTTISKIVSSTVTKTNSALTGLKKTCGLFNTDTVEVMDTGTKESEISTPTKSSTTADLVSLFEGTENMDEKMGNFDDFLLDINNFVVDDTNVLSTTPVSTLSSDELNIDFKEIMSNNNNSNVPLEKSQDVYRVKSNLMKRVENQNKQMDVIKVARQDSFNLNLDEELKGIFTPTIANACHEFIKSLPTPQISLTNLNTSDLLLQTPLISNEQTTGKNYSNERNPFMSSLSAEVRLNQQTESQQQFVTLEQVLLDDTTTTVVEIQKQISTAESVTLDHDYTISPRKRKISSIDEDSIFNFEPVPTATKKTTFQTQASSSQESTMTASTPSKRKRIKGIYRANDVTNSDELQNYLERRRKNNISSKQSRLTKKNLYANMEDKCKELEDDNEQLKRNITHLEDLTKLLKDVLLQRFTSNIK